MSLLYVCGLSRIAREYLRAKLEVQAVHAPLD